MAPEVLQKQPTTAASDVYAWAVTVNEIATGIFPFADCTKDNPQCQTVLNFGYGRSGPKYWVVACSWGLGAAVIATSVTLFATLHTSVHRENGRRLAARLLVPTSIFLCAGRSLLQQ